MSKSKPCLLLTGPKEWHYNLWKKFKENGEVWMNYNDGRFKYKVQKDIEKYFIKQKQIMGYFIIYGYAKGTNKVMNIYFIDDWKISKMRISPPDPKKALEYQEYDTNEGDCDGPSDFKYVTWLHVYWMEKLHDPMHYNKFITFQTDRAVTHPALQQPLIVKENMEILYQIDQSFMPQIQDILTPDDYEIYSKEGKRRLCIHVRWERSQYLVKLFKKSLKIYDCIICGFNFEMTYGIVGEKYIEAHHIKPIAEIEKEEELISIKDFIPVCSNCHRMLHKRFAVYTWKELRIEIQKKNNMG